MGETLTLIVELQAANCGLLKVEEKQTNARTRGDDSWSYPRWRRRYLTTKRTKKRR